MLGTYGSTAFGSSFPGGAFIIISIENITLTESTVRDVTSTMSLIHDDITLNENINRVLISSISVIDSKTISENITTFTARYSPQTSRRRSYGGRVTTWGIKGGELS